MDVDLERPRADASLDDEDELFVTRTPYCLRPQCPEPPMPLENTANSSLLVDSESLTKTPDTGRPAIITCKKCASNLRADRVPACAIANHNYLGPVPPELQSLTVVECGATAARGGPMRAGCRAATTERVWGRKSDPTVHANYFE
ncbi:hypothetical protein B0H13DRAFT_2316701 [Mycena leptocephala]|nr:hypothetical protein B0H13DRAFT_2316701 [Mycena leptocephala]